MSDEGPASRFLPPMGRKPRYVEGNRPVGAVFGYCRRRMPPVFWIGLGIAGFVFLVGVVAGARSRTATLASGAAMGAYLGIMAGFPLLAIGLATS
jgi:hypothetical protein